MDNNCSFLIGGVPLTKIDFDYRGPGIQQPDQECESSMGAKIQ